MHTHLFTYSYSAKVHASLHVKWGNTWEDVIFGVLSITLSFPALKHKVVPESIIFGKKHRNRQRNITERRTKSTIAISKLSREEQQQIGVTSSIVIAKENMYAMIAENEVRFRLSSVGSTNRKHNGSDGTVTLRYLHEVVFKHTISFDLHSCKEAVGRSLSDLIPISCSVYPADISVQKCIMLIGVQVCSCMHKVHERKCCAYFFSLQPDD